MQTFQYHHADILLNVYESDSNSSTSTGSFSENPREEILHLKQLH